MNEIPDWMELARQAELANTTPLDIPTAIGGPPPQPEQYPTGGWQPTPDRQEGWVVYINPRTREVAVERDGERLVSLERSRDEGPPIPPSPSRCREIAAECPLRWQDVRRILEEHSGLGYSSWFEVGPADEVADFVWSCWLDAHSSEGG